jgi:hypothetical protein
MSDVPTHLRGATIMTPGDRIRHEIARADRRAEEKLAAAFPTDDGPVTDVEVRSLREWLASWGSGPNRYDGTGATVPFAKVTLIRLLDEIERLRASTPAPVCENGEDGA